MYKSLLTIVVSVFVFCCAVTTPLHAEDDSNDSTMELFGGDEPGVASSRFPRPISRIAENVTVITADDIARLNAHSVIDVLNTVPGIQVDELRTPGSSAFFTLEGASFRHVLVVIDGVPQNDLSDVYPELGAMPAHQVDRIQIIKGAASSAWGSALGGVVSITTKLPDPDRVFGGTISSSIGTRFTSDVHGELSGTKDRFGYHVSAGTINSDGLLPSNALNSNNFSGRFHLELPGNGSFSLGLKYHRTRYDIFEWTAADARFKNDGSYLSGFASLFLPLADRLSLEVLVREWSREIDSWSRSISNGETTFSLHNEEVVRGVTSKVAWGDSLNNLAAGAGFEHADMEQDFSRISADVTTRSINRWFLFGNGAASLGPLTILPGARLDHNGVDKNYVSFTLGATWRLSDKVTVRGYGARGYSLPMAIYRHGLQKIWTMQGGVESAAIPFLWLKGTFFYNDVSNIEAPEPAGLSLRDQVRQGFEMEAATTPVAGFSLRGGYTFVHARDRESGRRLSEVPAHLLKLALRYDDKRLGIAGTFTGSYAKNNFRPDYNPVDGRMLWDLHLNKKLAPSRELSPELFFSVRNLFNGSQHQYDFRGNAGRWLEGGIRFKF